ncbi:MAG: TetR/AcrR family transcriptional regulator [Rhizobiaceae bacterium]
MAGTADTKGRILRAAEEVSRDAGAGNLSLDAVAARAGISKGGLLYHFPSKARLFEAMVENYLGAWENALGEREQAGALNGVAAAYLDLFVTEQKRKQAPSSGLIAALAENPDFLAPVKRYERAFLDRMKANSTRPSAMLVIFLALHGLHSMKLLNTEIVTGAEFEDAVAEMRRMIDAPA